ncbi:MAG TPA: ATP-grasp domain-containing protein [Gemmatimonadaceae bacterium]
MKRVRVLVTDADSTKALAVVRALGPTMEVWTASETRFPLAAWSRHSTRHVVCRARPDEFARSILDICTKNAIDVVIPPEERTSFLLARERERFANAGVVLTAAPLATLEVALDKARTVDAARAAGVPVPKTATITDRRSAVSAARELGYPIVLKPRFSHYWAGDRFVSTDGVRYASSEAELITALNEMPQEAPLPLLQEFIPGRGLGIFLLLGSDGSVLAEFAHERLRDLRPTGSGSVLRRSVAVEPHLRELALRLLRHIGWRGAAMVEFRSDDRDGEPKLMEINGRLWGSLQLATDAGVNFPALLVDDALGKPNRANGYESGVVVRWWLGDLVRLFRVLKGRPAGFTGSFPSPLSAIWEFLGPQPRGTRQEILRWSDPFPAVGEIVSALARGRGP